MPVTRGLVYSFQATAPSYLSIFNVPDCHGRCESFWHCANHLRSIQCTVMMNGLAVAESPSSQVAVNTVLVQYRFSEWMLIKL